jgi:hypothetical protein
MPAPREERAMTLDEVRRKITETKAELRRLQELEWTLTGVPFIRGFGPTGIFAGDPAAAEAARLGKEWRDEVNRLSLEEMDREEAESNRVPPK